MFCRDHVMSCPFLQIRSSALAWLLWCIVGCTAPSYLPVPVANPGEQQYRGLSPSVPEQAIVHAQHLGQLQADMRYLEEVLVRAEQNRLSACRAPGSHADEFARLSAMPVQRPGLRAAQSSGGNSKGSLFASREWSWWHKSVTHSESTSSAPQCFPTS